MFSWTWSHGLHLPNERHLSEVSPTWFSEQFQCCRCCCCCCCCYWQGPLTSFQSTPFIAASFCASPLRGVHVVASLALCLQVMSQAPQHFRPSETQAAFNSWAAHGLFLRLQVLRDSRPTYTDVECCHLALSFPVFTFCSKLVESVRIMTGDSTLKIVRRCCKAY